MIIIA